MAATANPAMRSAWGLDFGRNPRGRGDEAPISLAADGPTSDIVKVSPSRGARSGSCIRLLVVPEARQNNTVFPGRTLAHSSQARRYVSPRFIPSTRVPRNCEGDAPERRSGHDMRLSRKLVTPPETGRGS